MFGCIEINYVYDSSIDHEGVGQDSIDKRFQYIHRIKESKLQVKAFLARAFLNTIAHRHNFAKLCRSERKETMITSSIIAFLKYFTILS